MANPVLVIMAAGMGSRYGGLKQIDPIGPNGQILLDYSIYDAHRAGFDRVVFIIRPELHEAFEDAIGKKARRFMQVDYAYQTLDNLPDGLTGIQSAGEIYEAMLRRNWNEDLVRDIFYNNLFEFMEKAL